MRLMSSIIFLIGFLLVSDGTKGVLARRPQTPVSKTVKTAFGDIYDCVDFYKQPAFEHPALKNHTFHPEMRPSSRPKWMVSKRATLKEDNKASYTGFKDGGCPSGTVPIRRVSKEDLARAHELSKKIFSSRIRPTGTELPLGTHRAVLQTKTRPTTSLYYGLGGEFSVWNPPTEPYQYSSAQFLIQNAHDSIQFGWTVNPTLYKENLTYMFIHTTMAGGSHCFNTQCPGFVITSAETAPDNRLKGYSVRGKQIMIFDWFVYQDKVNGHWWLEVGAGETKPIGFWPKEIFGGLAVSGTYIASGGEAYTTPEQPEGPYMGTGDYVMGPGSFEWDAYCQKFVTVNGNYKIVPVDDTERFSDFDKYEVKGGDYDDRYGRYFFFGGPGR